MNKLTIFILISAAILAFVAVSIIPQTIIPDYDSEGFLIRKERNSDIGAVKSGETETLSADECGLSVYNIDCDIAEYLEKNFVAATKGGKVFCAYEKIGQSDGGDMVYLNYSCEEFYPDGGKIYEGSGAAGPAKIIKLDDGSLSHWVPRDGSYFARDINEFFPSEYRDKAMDSHDETIWQINRERAKIDFNADFDYKVEKTTDIVCVHDFECSTPGDYLAMSRCPFASMCVAGRCAVICPNFQNLDN
ncbi:MAG: hypothetical protein WA093_00130 [Minisyncoccales bacterium]